MTDIKSAPTPISTELRPNFEEIQAHYDLSDDFFGVFQDPSRTYSCAFFERDDMTLEEAQLAKIDLALGKLDLRPGMTLLDIGCGWGSVMKRAIEEYDVNVVGLTLSRNQYTYCARLLDDLDTRRSRRVSLHGWEEFDEPVDRIVSIEAFEAFPKERYAAFFETCHRILPDGGRMVLQTIMGHPLKRWPEMGIPIVMSDLKFMRFIAKEIFPGGSVPCDEDIVEYSAQRGSCGGGHSEAQRALCPHPRHLGQKPRSRSRRGCRCDVRRGLRPLPALPDRMRRLLPPRHQRAGTIHPEEWLAGGQWAPNTTATLWPPKPNELVTA